MPEANYRDTARKWYRSARWQRLRKAQLSKHPICQCPHKCGLPATVVDHIKPHRGSASLFFNANNLQSLTEYCHNSTKQMMERSGKVKGCDAMGNPITGW